MDKLGDQIIAIVAVIFSGTFSILVAATSAFVSFYNNKETIKAKRLEIAFDKRLEAYRDLAERIGKILYYCSEKQPTDPGFFQELEAFHEGLYDLQQRQRIFLTAQMDSNISNYLSIIYGYLSNRYKDPSKEKYEQFYKALKKQGYAIFNEMHELMGYA